MKWIDKTTPCSTFSIGITTALVVAIIQELEKHQLPLAERIISAGLIGIGLAIIGAILIGGSESGHWNTSPAGEFLMMMGIIVAIGLPIVATILLAWPIIWQKIMEHKLADGILTFSVVTSTLTKLWLKRRKES